ncbi:MAG: G3E family GTPase [Akkermansiaceae bacterium]|jgi:G3E family GTPase
MSSKQIPIVTLCGFLGSGKTTLLRRWRRDETLKEAPVIVHDLSKFGLDAELLSDEHSAPEQGRFAGRVAALHGSHAREELHASLGTVLDEISALDPVPPVVLCESTGAARPWPLIKALTQSDQFFLRHFIVTVDGLNLHRDFEDGRILTGDAPGSQDAALHRAAEILAEQIAFANVIILTKIDTIPKETVEAQVKNLQKLQPNATIGLSAQAGIFLSQLEATPAPKLSVLESRAEQFGLTGDSATIDDVEALILRDSRPFHPERLFEVCQSKLTTGVYRTKGFLWLASRPAHVLLWQQSGSQIAFELTGTWRAEIVQNQEVKLLPEEIEHLKAQLETKHPVFGDRHNELTFIGLKAELDSFASALRDALCTDEEVAAWQEGKFFSDPWPKSIRSIE